MSTATEPTRKIVPTERRPTKLESDFRAVRRVSAPLIAITTSDQGETIGLLVQHTLDDKTPVVRWDIGAGLRACNKAGKAELEKRNVEPALTQNPVEALTVAASLPPGACIFMINAHLFFREPTYIQAIWNLRDDFKTNRRTLVMLGIAMKLPPELEADVIVFDEPLPTAEELADIVASQFANAGLKPPDDDTMRRAVDAVTGLPVFTAEQVTAMSLTKEGLSLEALWDRKRKAIEQTPGLTVWRGGETFEDIGGCDNFKIFANRVIEGEDSPHAVVYIDEIEKMLAGIGSGGVGDSSGTSQDQLGQLLSYMQDTNASGMILIGPPGAAKSAVAKAMGNTAQIPTIQLDLGGMKGSLVGESEARIRAALKVITAVSQNKALWVATCNSIGNLPPELRRRFTFGTFFFDLPTPDERAIIWDIYIRRMFNLSTKDYLARETKKLGKGATAVELPDATDWTGAEIRQCVILMYRLRCTPEFAAQYIVPVAKSARETIDKLRRQASGRFISAARPGFYEHVEGDTLQDFVGGTSRARAIDVN